MGYKRKKSTRKSRRPKGKKMKTIKKMVSKMITKKAEKKQLITYTTESTVNTLTSPASFNNALLNDVGQGNASYQRIGERIEARYLDIRGHLITPLNAFTAVRFIVLTTKAQEVVTSDLWEKNDGTFSSAGQDFVVMNARLNTPKYRILKDKCYQVLSGGIVAAKRFHFRIPLKNMKIHWTAGGVYPEQQIRFIILARRIDNDEELGTNLEYSWNSKFVYTDL